MSTTFLDLNCLRVTRWTRALLCVLSVIVGLASLAVRTAAAEDSAEAKDAAPEALGDSKEPAEDPNLKLNWQQGPMSGQLGVQAKIDVPEGYGFLNAADTQLFMQMLENPVNGSELGTVSPHEANWFVVFEFNNSGYVKDDDKGKLDADAMLKSMKEGNKAANNERIKRGWTTMEIVGWEEQPNYDRTTHNLQWCIKALSNNKPLVNYNTRILGRSGVMVVTLVTDPEVLPTVLPEFKKLLAGFQFSPGNTYAEFRRGDKIAQYGLTALVTGGGLAIAAKTGLLAQLGLILAKAWKAIVVGVLALGAAIKSFFTRKKTAA